MANYTPHPSTFSNHSSPLLPDFALERRSAVRTWDQETVCEWLRSIKCQKYELVFTGKFYLHGCVFLFDPDNHITGDTLLECDQQELKELGITKVGDRIRILVAIKALRTKHKKSRAPSENTSSAPSPYDPQYVHPTPPPEHSSGLSKRFSSVSPSNPRSLQSPAHDVGHGHQRNQPSIDANANIMSIDSVRQSCVKFIGEGGQTRIVNIQNCTSAGSILQKALKKFNLQDDWTKWCASVTTESGSARKVPSEELVQICHDPSRSERERLILRLTKKPPSVEDYKRAHSIAREQQAAAAMAGNLSSNAKMRKLETFFGERPSPSSNSSPSQTPTSGSHLKGPQKRLRNFFGQRPPSELISSNLAEYFPGHGKEVLEQTVRNSMMRRSRYRFSVATQGSSVSTRDAPPVPVVNESWLQGNTSAVSLAKPPARPPRPLSLRRVIPAIPDEESQENQESSENQQDSTPDDMPFRRVSADRRTKSSSRKSSRASHVSHLSIAENPLLEETEEATIVPCSASQTCIQITDVDGEAVKVEGEYEEGIFLDEEEPDYDDHGPTKWIRGALIGMGSFGSVYLGMNQISGELMAVKQVELPEQEVQGEQRKKTMLDALQHEIALLRELQHENIVQYLGSNSDDTHLNIFLEYVPGGSVTALLNNYGAFEEPLIRNFVRQILQGLSYLHERDIIHRDIKGANILVDNKGGIKISDFGISKKVEANLLSTAPNHRPSLQGSVYWMAPEVVKQTSYTRKADIWSLGCLIVEMMTGTHPFPEFSQMQAIFKIGTSCSPDIPPAASAEAQDFLSKTFELDHHLRPTSTTLLIHEFLAPLT
ncbi:Protein kinase byr2 [Neolecta irregularis DAH-3]|uniref:mitogen-activated protein kinase kinase kinase n=1 Tax=Neolecta irregularis (strain DAH-3) TaxID=1198029 RepID=A0A1U7LG53_NEOID|nr:Protein kinase byr2 [Neolecta irregularis DAH-3]|eukprot:OLL21636.1 Protein kinase byr2 [Neolecta irregularis DAH-3]